MRRILLLCELILMMNTLGIYASLSKDSLQNLFPAGKIISTRGDISCYRLNGIFDHGAYGYCIYDTLYTPKFSGAGRTFDRKMGMIDTYYNSKCYTIIAPTFSYALPFSDGWGAVCIDSKWSYVSACGTFLCDFVLDAAYPFNGGKAKVIYKGTTYDIDVYGNGLPKEILRETKLLSKRIKALSIVQLSQEQQHEMAIIKGQKFFSTIVDCQNAELLDVSSSELSYAFQAQEAAIASQNTLLSLSIRDTSLFDYYHDINLVHRFSPESELYALNRYNANFYFNMFRYLYPSDSVVCQILNFANEFDYKSSILLFEEWIKNKGISITDSAVELMVYYYLAELSNDFETANLLLIPIAQLYENNGFEWVKDTYQEGVLLLNIRKFKSAKTKLEQVSKIAKREKKIVEEIACYWNLAILYGIINNKQECLLFYESVRKLKSKIDSETYPELQVEVLASYIDYLINNNLWTDKYNSLLEEYVQLEIQYNVKTFTTIDFLHAGRIWGKSNIRIQKVLQHLEKCTTTFYLGKALVLSSFQQNILQDSERFFYNSIRHSTNDSIRILSREYFTLKQDYKGFDLFDESQHNIGNKEMALNISRLEQKIKDILVKSDNFSIDIDYLFPIKVLEKNEVVIDVFEYTLNSRIKKYGVFVVKYGNEIHFVPLGKENRFSTGQFWPAILRECDITPNSLCYLVLGKLDHHGIEYEEINKGEIAYFKYNIHRIYSLSCLNSFSNATTSQHVALFGGLDYGNEFIAKTRGVLDDGYLEYSLYEIDTISTIIEGQLDITKFSDTIGTSNAFRKIASVHPEIIHLATHGYQKDLHSSFWDFNQDRFDYYRQFTDVENLEWLMNNTGVFLSFDKADSTNILCSREVASFDLSKTRLVVLSACSTISGASSDLYMGSVGLTMAFAIAQTQNIITSLRKVYDKQTYEFMISFYQKFSETNDIYSSFKDTVYGMRRNYPRNRDIWGSFVLLENQR